MPHILIFDTTLRDGAKSPGTILTLEERLRIAKQLARLNVDILEVGFPAASEEQYEAVEQIAREIQGPVLAALARATNPRDFDVAAKALEPAEKIRLHTFVPASREYREHFLKKSAKETLKLAVSALGMARRITPDVEFSLVDAFRAALQDVVDLVRAAAEAGATTVTLADTVGYATPRDIARVVREVREELEDLSPTVLSIHCHNDLGLAVANSLAAIENGATQVHCTVNGIGERAGNTPLEELVAALSVHAHRFDWSTQITLDQISATSRLVRRLTGVGLQPHKPIVGPNAFICETVVPQLADAVEAPPYEIMSAEKLGIQADGEFLAANCSLDEFKERVAELGYQLESDELVRCFEDFKELAERKEAVFDADLELLVGKRAESGKVRYKLLYLNVTAGSIAVPNATVQLEVDGQVVQDAGFGHGPVDAAFRTICRMVKRAPRLVRYEVNAVTPGTDAQGEVVLRLDENGVLVNGRAVDTDIVLASAKALIDALNKLESVQAQPAVSEFTDEEGWVPII